MINLLVDVKQKVLFYNDENKNIQERVKCQDIQNLRILNIRKKKMMQQKVRCLLLSVNKLP